MPTYALAAADVPTPIAVPAPVLGQPTTPFTTAQLYPPPGTSLVFNQVAAALVLLCQNGGGGYGILTGLDLFAVSGLLVGVNPGIAVGDGILQLVASNAKGEIPFRQVLAPSSYTLADDATNYVWLTSTGSLVADTVKTYPAQAKWFLGTVTTVAGDITDIDSSGVVTLEEGRFRRTTADIGAPTDAPGFHLETLTTTGVYRWTGVSHAEETQPANVQTLAADLVLDALSPTVHFLKTNGSGRSVKLPDLTTIPTGRGFSIFNYDAAQNITVKDSAGSTLTTLTPGQSIGVPSFLNSSGDLVWPGSFTPGTPTAGPASITL